MSISVLYVVSNLDIGGAERHISLVIPRLNQEQIKPAVFTIIGKGALAGEIEKHGFPVLGPDQECRWDKMSKLWKVIWLIRGAVRLFLYLRHKRPDVIHFFLPMPYLLGGLVSLLSGARYRVMSRRSLNRYQLRYPGIANIEGWLHKHMDRVLANSETVLNELRDEGASEQQLGLIYNGVDVPERLDFKARFELRNQLCIGNGDLIIIMVANLIPYKGHDDLLRGLAEVIGDLPLNWKLICVGHDNHGIMAELVALSDELGIQKHVLFLGRRTDVTSLLQVSDVAVLCSHEEGFSNAVLEGMAAGLPLVVTDVGGNAEAVRDGIDGYVVPAHSPKDLGAAIAKLLNDPLLQKNMGNSARDRVEACFSMPICVASYEEMYDEVLNNE